MGYWVFLTSFRRRFALKTDLAIVKNSSIFITVTFLSLSLPLMQVMGTWLQPWHYVHLPPSPPRWRQGDTLKKWELMAPPVTKASLDSCCFLKSERNWIGQLVNCHLLFFPNEQAFSSLVLWVEETWKHAGAIIRIKHLSLLWSVTANLLLEF